MAVLNKSSKWKTLLKQRPDDKNDRPSKTLTLAPPNFPKDSSQKFADKYTESTIVLGDSDSRKVFLAERKSDKLCVAVKRFERQYTFDSAENHLRKVKFEYRVGSQLRHRNIIQNIELFEDKDGSWLQVMEYAPFNLFDRVKAMSHDEIDCFFAQISAGVQYIHQAGLAHRDLKLENIVFTQSGEMKIIDFGVSTVCRVADEPVGLSRDMVGCRPYMAPEIIQRIPYDPQLSDIWALAILYCCMVFKKFPWKEASAEDRRFMDFIKYASKDSTGHKEQQQDLEYAFNSEKNDIVCIIVAVESALESRRAQSAWPPAQLLSEDSWAIIREMLRVSPQRRPKMQQIMNSAWVNTNRPCSRFGSTSKPGSISHSHGP